MLLGEFRPGLRQWRPDVLFDLLQAFGVSIRLVGNAAEAVLNAFAEFVGFGAQLLVREFLHLGLKHIDPGHAGTQALNFAIIPGSENLA